MQLHGTCSQRERNRKPAYGLLFFSKLNVLYAGIHSAIKDLIGSKHYDYFNSTEII